jgi:hypothetical protein
MPTARCGWPFASAAPDFGSMCCEADAVEEISDSVALTNT